MGVNWTQFTPYRPASTGTVPVNWKNWLVQSLKKRGTLHSEGATEPRQPIGSDVAPLDLKKSNTSKFVKPPTFAFSLQKKKILLFYSENMKKKMSVNIDEK